MGRTILLLLLLMPLPLLAQDIGGLEVVTVTPDGEGGQTWSLTIQVLVLMTALTLLPSIVLMFTSFTRIIVVLAIMRQAMGTATTPPNQVLIGLALFLTFFIMAPVLQEINEHALQPYLQEDISLEEAIERGREPIHAFMRYQVRERDLAMFASLAGYENGFEEPEDVPFSVLVPAFLTSELKTAFQIGFMIYIPFVIIDLVVASTLMSMGMMMLSPMLVSLPFKLMLFVLVDGWGLVTGTLASSFLTPAFS
ncbi:flagellar type III secretion system pore protein FliP [Wenzhouxiangella sp. AB-CW3]|uniref:flagellar type III secretion system pore protein FliP n=1 Tax=Wenzhouxiangella sp. AB-CW3 TaxID=2771012 RepID=UPI001CC31E60|nr:flagellar type III secretion system pore protein FliP [Wenzhouxiangella sp. AB-CW3]